MKKNEGVRQGAAIFASPLKTRARMHVCAASLSVTAGEMRRGICPQAKRLEIPKRLEDPKATPLHASLSRRGQLARRACARRPDGQPEQPRFRAAPVFGGVRRAARPSAQRVRKRWGPDPPEHSLQAQDAATFQSTVVRAVSMLR